MDYPREVQREQKEMKAKVQSRKREKAAEDAEAGKASLTKGQQNVVEQASERGGSTWLTAIPMTKYGFQLNQTGLRRCTLFKIWLDTREVALTLPMWGDVLSGTCLQLFERTLAFNQA